MSDTAKPNPAKLDTTERDTAMPGSSARGDGDLMSRRTVIGAAAATVAAGVAAQAAEPHVKGPPVWLDMDQKELDDAYDQSVYAPNRDQMSRRRVSESRRVRERLGEPARAAYGATPHEMLDIYPARDGNGHAPIAVFIHGGAWRSGMAKDSSYGAEPFVRAGAHFVVLDFIDVIESGGDLTALAGQVRRGVAWAARNAASFGGDASRLYVIGHSSGAHLGGCVLITDWEKDFGLPRDTVKGATLCSGMYDLKPVRLSKRSEYVKFTDAMEEALSTQRHLDRINCPVTLLHGTLDTPEFQRQTGEFAAALKAAGKPVRLIVGENYNHYEIGETLNNPYGPFGHAALEIMHLE
jgi:arylformamidase